MKHFHSLLYIYGLSLLLLSACKSEAKKQGSSDMDTCLKSGMVVTAHPLATQVGLEVLQNGGNAFDAAVAVKFALAVVYPRAGNISGGGFMVFVDSETGPGALNFREKAPLQAERDMFLDADGEVIEDASTLGHLSIGVPGTVDGMVTLHREKGSLPWEDLMAPAIRLADEGFSLTEMEADKLNDHQVIFSLVNEQDMLWLHRGSPWQGGDTIKNPELKLTLERISQNGRDGFYKGRTAEMLLAEIRSGGGIITQEDLDAFSSTWMEPLVGSYRGHTVLSMPPPSSGGIALLQLLKGIESYNVDSMGHNTVSTLHLMTELERRVYADRATHLGDPDFWEVPDYLLLDPAYIQLRNSTIDMSRKTNSQDIKEGEVDHIESVETTHFSILDQEGNTVALTTTLNGNYGSKVMVEGAGFFLNNQMDDFSIKPGHPNMYGLVGAEANSIEPGKRMLSSMTPTIVMKDDEVFLILGTPGGATIITSVFQNILNVIDHGMSLEESIKSKRVHHQWLPDRVIYEYGGLDYEVIEGLQKLGHRLETRPSIGRVDAILVDEECLIGVGDPRGDDTAAGF
ncbi:MAG: gamma-glutamyltransferase [Flavobacteriales bacterium]|nr:gamma-glutamyltransferase [Flavobacteriales bacterium]